MLYHLLLPKQLPSEWLCTEAELLSLLDTIRSGQRYPQHRTCCLSRLPPPRYFLPATSSRGCAASVRRPIFHRSLAFHAEQGTAPLTLCGMRSGSPSDTPSLRPYGQVYPGAGKVGGKSRTKGQAHPSARLLFSASGRCDRAGVFSHSGAQCGGPRSLWTGGGSKLWGGGRPSGAGSPVGAHGGVPPGALPGAGPGPAETLRALRRPSGPASPGGRVQKGPRRWCVPNAAPSRGICAGKHTSLGATFTILLRAGLAGLGADS